jgi:diguanylate cyclase (GGDEF)-like protein/PAS domain S-box-containing protein
MHLFNAKTADDIIGKTDFDFFTVDHAQPAFEAEQQIIATGLPIVDLEERETWPDREDTWVVTTKMPLRDHTGRIIGTFGMSRDITQRKRLAVELEAKTARLAGVEAELRRLLESSPDAMLRYDAQLRHVYANPVALALFGRSVEDVVGSTARELGLPRDFLDIWEPALRKVIQSGDGAIVEFGIGNPDRLFFEARMVVETGDDGDVVGVFVIVRDLTDRKRAEDALALQAVQDPLTGLANRILLVDRLEQALVRLERQPGRIAVLFLDLDRFKVVNDSLGHAAGDALLIDVAGRLRLAARRSDTVARFGGDEFVMLCERLSADEDAAVIAGRITRALSAPFTYDGKTIHLTGSLGIAVTDDSGTRSDALIRDADAAMYQAKERGHGNGSYQFFDAGVRERAVARMTMEGQLHEALERAEFRLIFQPLVTLDESRRLLGLEALIRWQHPERGLLAPDAFMAVAEDTNLIIPIGRWVLDEACRQLALWNARRDTANPLTMAVNVSARQLGHPSLPTDVAESIARHCIEPRLLTIELTETALLEEAVTSGATLATLSALGVRLALDDFGTGYSSLGHLRRYPVDILKIDRSFVDGLDGRDGDAAIVGAVTAMAHALGMVTVGEGIETKGQFEALRALGCDEGQGFLMARPMRPEQLEDLLAEHAALEPRAE